MKTVTANVAQVEEEGVDNNPGLAKMPNILYSGKLCQILNDTAFPLKIG
jgi:hypothetical protein